MNIPLIGGQKERKERQAMETKAKWDEEMYSKLAEWELSNGCMVRAEMNYTTQNITAVLTMNKMDEATKKIYEEIKANKEKANAQKEQS